MPAILYTHRKRCPPLGNGCTPFISTKLGQISGSLVPSLQKSKIFSTGALMVVLFLQRCHGSELLWGWDRKKKALADVGAKGKDVMNGGDGSASPGQRIHG